MNLHTSSHSSGNLTEPSNNNSHFEVTFHSENDRGYSGKMGSVLFESCTGLTTEVGVMLIGDAQSGMGTRAVRSGKVSGKIHFEKTLSSQSAELTRWFLDVLNPEKKLKRMNLHLTIRSNKSDNPIASKWRIQNAWPCSWSGPILDTSQSGIALESVTFIHEGITPILD